MEGGAFLYLSILLALVAVTCVVFVLIIMNRQRRREDINYSLSMALILVSVPLYKDKNAPNIDIKKVIGAMEQFYASLAEVKPEGWLKGMFKRFSALAFEIALPAIGEEIHFYVSVPRAYVEMAEKQITSFLPGARVEWMKNDYNIFNPAGVSSASYLTLSKSFFLPVKTYQNLESDPLNFITNAMSKLEFRGEGCAVQMLICPRSDWQETAQKIIWEMKNGKPFSEALSEATKGVFEMLFEMFHQMGGTKKDGEEEKKKQPVRALDDTTIKAIEQKASKAGFDANIRLVASALTQTRAEAILSGLENVFRQFDSINLNGFAINRARGRTLQNLLYDFSFRNFSGRQSMLLNTEEITSVFHFPTPYLETKKIKSLKARSAPLPVGMPAEGLVIGKNVHRGEEKEARITREDRFRHLYILGQTGTGKSVSLQNMIVQDIEKGEGVCLIDPHGETVERVLAKIPKHRIDDVILFDPGDLDRPLGINMLEYDSRFPEQKSFIVNEMVSIFDKLYDLKATGGPMFEQYMRNALMLIMLDPESGSTLLEVPRVFSDQDFRKLKLSRANDPLVKNFWQKEAEKAGGDAALANMTPYVTSKFNTFIANEFMRPIIAQQKSSINFREIIDTKKIFLVNLSKGRVGEINSSLLGLIIVGKLLMAALSRADTAEEERKDFYLYIDEFQNFATDSISVILSEARKYRLSLMMAHQFIGQLKDNIKNAVFGNVGSMLIFRAGIEDAQFLEKQFEPEFSANDIANLDNLNAYAKILINGVTARPFNIAAAIPKPGNSEIAKIAKELSRLKYGRDRRQIEMEIEDRFNIRDPISAR